MLILPTTSDVLRIVTGQAQSVDVHASYVDSAAGGITPGRTNTAITTAATTTVVPAPGASTARNVKYLTARNKGAGACDVTVQAYDGATAFELYKQTLQSGDSLQYTDETGFAVGPSAVQPFSTGDAKLTMKNVADTGWILMNDGTIGSATSGATTRANADCQNLFMLLWNNITNNTYAPVSGGRGANAAADWGANKTIQTLAQLGRALIIGGSGAGLTARSLGQFLGEESHGQAVSEMVNHAHPGSGTTGASTSGQIFSDSVDSYIVPTNPGTGTITISGQGGGSPANVMQPSTAWNIMLKL